MWWYLHKSGLQKLGVFIKQVEQKASDERFPGARGAWDAVLRSVASAVVGPDEEEPSDAEITKRTKKRAREILAAFLSKTVDDGDDDGAEEPPAEGTDAAR